MAYQTSTNEHPLDILNLNSLEELAQETMDPGAFGFVKGGAEDEVTLTANTQAFNHKQIVPRILQGLNDVDLRTSLWNLPLASPIIEAPFALHKVIHQEGEIASAKGIAAAGSIFPIGTYTSVTMNEVARAVPEVPQFLQLYLSKSDLFNKYILDKALEAGCKGIILTADSTVGGYREADIRNRFHFPVSMAHLKEFEREMGPKLGSSTDYKKGKQNITPADLTWIKEYTKLPLILKGVQSPLDAEVGITYGADAIWISNHGGRQLDGGPAAFDVLPTIAKVVKKRVPIIFDSGVRRGQHVFKALASGADFVGICRPLIYGLYLGGAAGVKSVFDHLNKELSITMALAGTRTIEDIKQVTLL